MSSCREHHLDRPARVHVVRHPGILEGSDHRSDSRLVEDDLAPGDRFVERRAIEDAPLGERGSIAQQVQTQSLPGREVVDDVDLGPRASRPRTK